MFEISLKNSPLLIVEGCYANKIHHFLLEMVSSIQIDSMLGLSQWGNLLPTKLVSRLVSSMQGRSILDVQAISLNKQFSSFKEFILTH